MNKIKIIGVGPGTKEYLLPIALRKIKASDCLIGARRILSEFKGLRKEEFIMEGNLNKIIPFVKEQRNKKKIAILVSGDPGLYSFLDTISRSFKKEEYEVIPGISSLQLAFSRAGEGWQDARIISLHGRGICDLAQEVNRNKMVFFFTDGYFPPQKIAAYLIKNGIKNRRALVFEQLGYPQERIADTTLEELARMDGFKLCVMLIK
jgi:cobalt-precorrin-7 (C5)-methyltransferase